MSKIIDQNNTKTIDLLSEIINLSSETINIDTKQQIYCLVLFLAIKTTQNGKFFV